MMTEPTEHGKEHKAPKKKSGGAAALAAAEARCAEYLEALQRSQAEFDNYRKRTDKERMESAFRASVNLIMRLIPVIDDFDRAIAAAETDEAAARFTEGLTLIRSHLMKALEDEGLTEIEAEGLPFNPHIHEAIMQEPSDEHEDEHIIEVLRKGYRLGETVVRPAMVKIARNDG